MRARPQGLILAPRSKPSPAAGIRPTARQSTQPRGYAATTHPQGTHIMDIHTVNQGSGEGLADRPAVISTDRTRAVFGQVMGLVALTIGCLALGAYIGRDLSGGIGIAFFLAGFACVIGLNIASARGHDQLSTTFLFG